MSTILDHPAASDRQPSDLPAMAHNTAATYNAAADHFDDAPLSFWDRHGRHAVDRLGLRAGGRVLDVGCGTGASALPAAAAVGPFGHVIGIDIADKLLDRARAKARAQALTNVTFRRADMTATAMPDAEFDAVISVFSIFFVADMTAQLAELWRLVRPGGQLAVTVWAADPFQPGAAVFRQEIERVRPDISWPARPWQQLTDPDALRRLFRAAGTAAPTVEVIDDAQRLTDATDFWTMVMGSGFRGEVEQLAPAHRAAVRDATVHRLAADRVTAINTGAIHAIATKPY